MILLTSLTIRPREYDSGREFTLYVSFYLAATFCFSSARFARDPYIAVQDCSFVGELLFEKFIVKNRHCNENGGLSAFRHAI